MPPASGSSQRAGGAAPPPLALAPGACWRQELPGEESQLSVLRRRLTALLPSCPARDDVIAVANELACNAVRHTLSGQGGRFTVEVTWHGAAVQVAVTDSGAATGPAEIDEPDGEHGRGLLLVRELSLRWDVCGDERGRRVWADVPWTGTPWAGTPSTAAMASSGRILAGA